MENDAGEVYDPNSSSQRLRFWVDTDQDGDFSDETTLLDTTAIDDDMPMNARRST
jgi:hypothetical protein